MLEIRVGVESNGLEVGDGGHYSIYCPPDPMALLRRVFPDGNANEMNFCIFSTSGIHGSYNTIEDVEREPLDEEGYENTVTFLVIQPRVVVMQYGVIESPTAEDIDFLKRLRKSSKEVIAEIGEDDE